MKEKNVTKYELLPSMVWFEVTNYRNENDVKSPRHPNSVRTTLHAAKSRPLFLFQRRPVFGFWFETKRTLEGKAGESDLLTEHSSRVHLSIRFPLAFALSAGMSASSVHFSFLPLPTIAYAISADIPRPRCCSSLLKPSRYSRRRFKDGPVKQAVAAKHFPITKREAGAAERKAGHSR